MANYTARIDPNTGDYAWYVWADGQGYIRADNGPCLEAGFGPNPPGYNDSEAVKQYRAMMNYVAPAAAIETVERELKREAVMARANEQQAMMAAAQGKYAQANYILYSGCTPPQYVPVPEPAPEPTHHGDVVIVVPHPGQKVRLFQPGDSDPFFEGLPTDLFKLIGTGSSYPKLLERFNSLAAGYAKLEDGFAARNQEFRDIELLNARLLTENEKLRRGKR